MKKTLLTVILIVVNTLQLLSQNTSENFTNQFNVIEPSAAELGKYGSYPVDLSSGLVNINIPLITIQSGDIQVPISLSYHGGGITVNESATWVGLGWNLNYGGSLSRTLNGYPDELEDFSAVPDVGEIYDLMEENPLNHNNPYLQNLTTANEGFSFMQDEYHYNVNSTSGVFILDNENNPMSLPFSDDVIDFNTQLHKTTISTSEGMKFVFNVPEYTDVVSNHSNFPNYISTWLLERISNCTGPEEVTYTYQEDGTISSLPSGYYTGYSISQKRCGDPLIGEVGYPSCSLINLTGSQSTSNVFSKKPQYIYFQNGRLTFVLGNRDDILCNLNSPPGIDKRQKKLDQINVEKLNSDGTYAIIYTIRFVYSYFEACNKPDPRFPGKIFPTCLRLRLDEIEKYIPNENLTESIARFDYIDNSLPEQGSFSVDYWGYYNGKQNTDPIPYTVVGVPCGTGTSYEIMGHADKSTDVNYAMNFILDKISYPTGGSTHFEWELNRYGNFEPIVNMIQNENISLNFNYSNDFIHSNYNEDDDIYKFYNISNDVAQTIKISHESMIEQCDFDHETFDQLILRITNTEAPYNDIFYSNIIGCNQFNETKWVYMPVGNYRVSIERNCGHVTGAISFQFNAYDHDLERYNYPIGGLRIHSVSNKDIDDEVIDIHEYTYIRPDNGHSSGVLVNSHTKNYVDNTIKITPVNVGLACANLHTNTTLFHSDAVCGVYSNSVSYQYVQEVIKNPDLEILSKTEYEFSVAPDFYISDFIPLTTNSYNRGQLINKTDYKYENSLFSKVSEIDNFYSCDNRNSKQSVGFKMIKYQTVESYCSMCPTAGLELVNCYGPTNFWYYSKWAHLDSTINSNYFNNNIVETTTNYFYDNDKYTFSNRSLHKLNDGLTKTIITKYPYDITDNSSIANNGSNSQQMVAISKMLSENCISYPIETYTILSDKVIDATYFNYLLQGEFIKKKGYMILQTNEPLEQGLDLSNSNSDLSELFNPSGYITKNSIYSAVIDNHYCLFPEINIQYDLINNMPSEMTRLNSFPSTYNWGYNHNKIISSTMNATLVESGYTGFENGETNSFDKTSNSEFNTVEYFTGKASLLVPSGNGASKYFQVGSEANKHSGYMATVWAKGNGAYLKIQVGDDGTTLQSDAVSSNEDKWFLLKVEIPRAKYYNLTDPQIKVYIGTSGSNAYFDDLRFHPMDAQMTSYTYKPLVGITSSSDANNKPTYFEYDGFGRLILVRDFENNILKKYDYHYRPQ